MNVYNIASTSHKLLHYGTFLRIDIIVRSCVHVVVVRIYGLLLYIASASANVIVVVATIVMLRS